MKRMVFLAVALILTTSFGVAEGVWTGRWVSSGELDAAGARVAEIPQVIGPWEGTDSEFDAREIALARLVGQLRRTYVHRKTGEAVTVMILCGKPGPISVHTPDVCFQGGGSVMAGAPAREKIAGADSDATDQFWSAKFERPGMAGTEASLAFWGWSTSAKWEAADRPRVEYARSAFLYKLYVIRPLSGRGPQGADEPALNEFLTVFLPAARTALFPAR